MTPQSNEPNPSPQKPPAGAPSGRGGDLSDVNAAPRPYPSGFRPRRGLNWGYLGLLYTSFYMCRYNLSIANKAISDQYHFSYSQMSDILTAWSLAYAFGQIFNGLLTDRIGGKKAMLIGAAGTIIMNVLFGAASAWGILGLFMLIRGIDGYVQSFGAPGMTKIKTAWFAKTERGGFAGIFGFMINLGRLGIFNFGPALLAGFTLFGMVHVSPLHWKWLFWGPSIVCAVVAVAMAFGVKETPEENGFMPVEAYTPTPVSAATLARAFLIGGVLIVLAGCVGYLNHINRIGTMDMGVIVGVFIVGIFVVLHFMAAVQKPPAGEVAADVEREAVQTTRADFAESMRLIVRNPAVWIVAAAYACTGAVRQPVDQWFPRYMQEVYQTNMQSAQFQFLAFLIPLVASAGSLISGYVSDKLFAGARAPVAAFLFFVEAVIVFSAAQFHTADAAVFFFILISFTCNSTHSILGTAAAMDIGGRKMTGFSSGLIDSFQYFGSSGGLWLLGKILDRWSWHYYFYYMVPFGLIGFLLMVTGRKTIARHSQR
jgi:sugar phosphate permease